MPRYTFDPPPPERQCTGVSRKTGERCTAWSSLKDPEGRCPAHAGLTKILPRQAAAIKKGTYEPRAEIAETVAELKVDMEVEREERYAAAATPPELSPHERAEGWRWVPRQAGESVNPDTKGLFRDKAGKLSTWVKVQASFDDERTMNTLSVERGAERDADRAQRIANEMDYLRRIHNDIRGMSREEIDRLPPLAIEVANLDPRLLRRGTTRDDLVDWLIAEEVGGVDVDLDSDESDKLVAAIVREELGL